MILLSDFLIDYPIKSLQSLNISCNAIRTNGFLSFCRCLENQLFDEFVYLNISDNYIENDGLEKLFSIIEHEKIIYLMTLDVSNNLLSANMFSSLLMSYNTVNNRHFMDLHYNNNKINSLELQVFSSLSATDHFLELESLYLNRIYIYIILLLIYIDTGITDDAVKFLCNGFTGNKCPVMKYLDLSHNKITSIGMSYLKERMKSGDLKLLTTLNLNCIYIYIYNILDNPLEDKGIKNLCDGLSSNNCLNLTNLYLKRIYINIYNNYIDVEITDRSCLYLGELLITNALVNTTDIDLSVNNLSSKGIFALSQKWKLAECHVCNVTHINLSATSIDSSGIKYINDMFLLGKFDKMNGIDFMCNKIKDSGIWHMSEIFIKAHPKNITSLNYSGIYKYKNISIVIVNYLQENSMNYIQEMLENSALLATKILNISCISFILLIYIYR